MEKIDRKVDRLLVLVKALGLQKADIAAFAREIRKAAARVPSFGSAAPPSQGSHFGATTIGDPDMPLTDARAAFGEYQAKVTAALANIEQRVAAAVAADDANEAVDIAAFAADIRAAMATVPDAPPAPDPEPIPTGRR